jgi:hypothetical protein
MRPIASRRCMCQRGRSAGSRRKRLRILGRSQS